MEEQKESVKKGNSDEEVIQIPIGKFVRKIKSNPWIAVSVVLALVLVLVLIFGRGSASSVSGEEAGQKLVDFINAQGNGKAEFVSASKEGSLYNIVVDYNGEQIPVYVSSDGKYLITDPIPLSENYAGTGAKTNVGPVNVVVGDAPAIGSVDAKVTVVEFSDFSCPYCAAASGDNDELNAYMKQRNSNWEPIVTNLMKDYVNTGKVRFAVKYRMGHSGGHPAQLVAWCLNDQNLYWKFYAKAFANQDDVEDLTKMKALAKTVGADMTKLDSCLNSKKYDSKIDAEQAEGTQYGVSGTPAFFVNGILVEGAVPYSQIKAFIESELAK